MNLFTRSLSLLPAIAMLATAGLMQGAEQCKLHLETPAHWGKTLLQPGDYKIFIPDASLDRMQLQVKGNGTSVFEIPTTTTYHADTNSSFVKLSSINGSYFVTEFSAAGKTFTFFVPKSIERREAKLAGANLFAAK